MIACLSESPVTFPFLLYLSYAGQSLSTLGFFILSLNLFPLCHAVDCQTSMLNSKDMAFSFPLLHLPPEAATKTSTACPLWFFF